MSDMNGNPHYEGLARFNDRDLSAPEISYMQAQATLALAWEARTANLIATLQVGAVDMTDWPQQVIDNFHRTSIEISQRMGIEGATE